LFQLETCVRGFEHLKSLYEHDDDFQEVHKSYNKRRKGNYLLLEGYLLKGTRLCVPRCESKELLTKEIHEGGLAGHYGKTRRHQCSRSTTSCQGCSRMFRTSSKGVSCTKLARGTHYLKGFTLNYLHPKAPRLM